MASTIAALQASTFNFDHLGALLTQVTRELTGAVNDIKELSQRAAAGSVQQGAAASEIDSLLARLQSLRSTVVATDNEEKRCLARLDSRLQHLAAAPDSCLHSKEAHAICTNSFDVLSANMIAMLCVLQRDFAPDSSACARNSSSSSSNSWQY
eukprot:21204-Heterococcus_DN1.PRE.8